MKVSLTVVNTMCNVDKSLIRASHRCTVIGSISVGESVFFLSSACDMLITSFRFGIAAAETADDVRIFKKILNMSFK